MAASLGTAYTSALVLIPPRHLWPAIQAIRSTHDKHHDRWMPHITLFVLALPLKPLFFFFSSHSQGSSQMKQGVPVCTIQEL